jgi:hypothetical protein
MRRYQEEVARGFAWLDANDAEDEFPEDVILRHAEDCSLKLSHPQHCVLGYVRPQGRGFEGWNADWDEHEDNTIADYGFDLYTYKEEPEVEWDHLQAEWVFQSRQRLNARRCQGRLLLREPKFSIAIYGDYDQIMKLPGVAFVQKRTDRADEIWLHTNPDGEKVTTALLRAKWSDESELSNDWQYNIVRVPYSGGGLWDPDLAEWLETHCHFCGEFYDRRTREEIAEFYDPKERHFNGVGHAQCGLDRNMEIS